VPFRRMTQISYSLALVIRSVFMNQELRRWNRHPEDKKRISSPHHHFPSKFAAVAAPSTTMLGMQPLLS